MPCFPPFRKGKRDAERKPRSQHQVSNPRPPCTTQSTPLEQPLRPQRRTQLIPTEPPTLTLDTSFGQISLSPFDLPQTSAPSPPTHPLPSRGTQLISTGAPTLTLGTLFSEFRLEPFDDRRQTRATVPPHGTHLSLQPAQTLAHDNSPSGSLGASRGAATLEGPSGSRHQLVPSPRLPSIAVETEPIVPRTVQRENSLLADSSSNLTASSPASPRSSTPRLTTPLPPSHPATTHSAADHSSSNLLTSSPANPSSSTPCVTPSLSATSGPATTFSGTVPSAISPSATLPSSTLPLSTLPSSTPDSETLPSSTLPSETLPSETLPSATLPSATTPSAPPPSAPSPTVDGPSVTTPTASQPIPSSAISPLVASSSSLPIELLYIVADCLAANNDQASRAALARIMCTSHTMYHMAARRLYRTIVVDDSFGRLVECLPSLPKRHGPERLCEEHNTMCGTSDIPWDPPVQAPLGTLELVRRFATTVIATDLLLSDLQKVFDKIGKQERWHWYFPTDASGKAHEDFVPRDRGRTARPSMFPGVSRVIVTERGYRRLQGFYTNTVARYGSTYGGPQHPLVELLGTEIAPHTLCIEYPSPGEIRGRLMADPHMADNPTRLESRIKTYLEGPSRWIGELTGHWRQLAAVTLYTTCDSHDLSAISCRVPVVTRVDRESGRTTQVSEEELDQARKRAAPRQQQRRTQGGCLRPIGHQGSHY